MEKTNILLIWESAEWGGIDTMLLELIKYWPEKSDHIVLVTNLDNRGASRLLDMLKNNYKIEVHYVGSRLTLNLFKSRNKFIKLVLKLLIPLIFLFKIYRYHKFISSYNFQIVLGINGGYPAAFGVLAGMVSAKIAKIPVRSLLIAHEATRPLPLLGLFYSMVDHILSYSLTSVICISKATRDALHSKSYLLTNHNLKSVVIYPSVPVGHIDNNQASVFPKSKKEERKKHIEFAIVGRVEDYKGHMDVITAMSLVPLDLRRKIKLKIIGKVSDAQVKRIQQFSEFYDISSQIYFSGYVSEPVVDVVRQSDALIVATRSFEGFGLTAAEAMLARVPLITSTAGALKEFCNDEVATCYEPGNITDLSEIMARFVINKSKFVQKTHAAFHHVQKFSSENMVKSMRMTMRQDYYSELSKRSKKSG